MCFADTVVFKTCRITQRMDDNDPPLSRRAAQYLQHIVAMEDDSQSDASEDGNLPSDDDSVAPTSDEDDRVVSHGSNLRPATGVVLPASQTGVTNESVEAPSSCSFQHTSANKILDDDLSCSDVSRVSDEEEPLPATATKRYFRTLAATPPELLEQPAEESSTVEEPMDHRDIEEEPMDDIELEQEKQEQREDSNLEAMFGPSYFLNYVESENISGSVELPEILLQEELPDETMQEELECEHSTSEQTSSPLPEPTNQPIYPGAPITIWESLTAILTFVQSEHLSGAGVGRLLSLIDLHLNQPNKLLKSRYSVFQLLEHVDEPVELHFFCSLCYKTRTSLNDLCDTCSDPTRKVEYFMTFLLAHQMKRLFQRPDFVQNIRYQQTRVKQSPHNIEDIYDAEIYKKAEAQGFTVNGITFMFNTDGVPVFKSSSYSLWPFYLTTLELPPDKRFLSENVMVAGIWGSTVKPHPNIFLVPIFKQLKILKEGIDVQFYGEEVTQKVTGTLICGTCDSPATASFLNMKIHSGFYSCPVCTTKGTHPGDSTVFPYEDNVPLRNMVDYERFVRQAVDDKIIMYKSIKHEELYCGIKGPTVLSSILDDIFAAMAIDGMHCLHLGVTKQMIKLWFFDNGKYKDRAAELSRKLMELSPPDYLQRLPQTVEKLVHWKASEFRSFLVNLSVVLLEDILDPEDHRHFCLLVKGVSLLNSKSISEADVTLAERLLCEFVQEFEVIYGVESVTHNVHMCLHLARSVKLLGPLWCVSCYMFEDLNGRLLNLVHGTRHVGLQIHSNIGVITHLPLMIHSLKEGPVKDYCKLIKRKYRLKLTESISVGTYCVGGLFKLKIEMAWVVGILRKENLLNALSEVLLFYKLLQDHFLFVSSLYKSNRISSFVKYSKESSVKYGNIICFAKVICKCSISCSCKPQYFAVVKPIPVTPKEVHGIQFDHLLKCNPCCQVESFFQCEAVPVSDLECILFKIMSGGNTYLAEPLNKYELE